MPAALVRLQAIRILTLEPERLQNRLATTRKITGDGRALTGDAQAACDFSFSASKFSPFFHRVSVMAAILRASVRRAMVGLMPLASDALVEILKRSGPDTGHGGGTFEQTFQIMIVVFVQAANGDLFLGAPQLAVDIAVFPADPGLQRQSAVGPQLALGAETMRGLDQRHRQGRSESAPATESAVAWR